MSNLKKTTGNGAGEELVPTPAGAARLDWFPAHGQPRAVALLGHVLALAYPLLGPGSPRELLSTGRPTLIIQGGNDPFGRPGQFPPLPSTYELVEIRAANRERIPERSCVNSGHPGGRRLPGDLAALSGPVVRGCNVK